MGVRFPLPAPSSLKWLSKRELTEFDVAGRTNFADILSISLR